MYLVFCAKSVILRLTFKRNTTWNFYEYFPIISFNTPSLKRVGGLEINPSIIQFVVDIDVDVVDLNSLFIVFTFRANSDLSLFKNKTSDFSEY